MSSDSILKESRIVHSYLKRKFWICNPSVDMSSLSSRERRQMQRIFIFFEVTSVTTPGPNGLNFLTDDPSPGFKHANGSVGLRRAVSGPQLQAVQSTFLHGFGHKCSWPSLTQHGCDLGSNHWEKAGRNFGLCVPLVWVPRNTAFRGPLPCLPHCFRPLTFPCRADTFLQFLDRL